MSLTRTSVHPRVARKFASFSASILAQAPCAATSIGAAAIAMALMPQLHAAPQDALGTGRGLEHRMTGGQSLDRNLQQGSGGLNTGGTGRGPDYRARNLIVTGNVAGGRGFRGNVNYTAESDFRASSSDDASYDFRAGSAYSDPRVIRAGTMGDRLNVARSLANVEYSRATTSGAISGFDLAGTRLRLDQSTASFSTPSTRRTMNDLTTAGVMDLGEQGRLRMVTSGFAGVRVQQDTDLVDTLNLGLYDTARLKQDLHAGRLDQQLDALRYRDPLRANIVEQRVSDLSGIGDAVDRDSPRLDGGRIDTGIRTMDTIVEALDRNLERSGFGMTPSTTEGRTPAGARDSGAREPGARGSGARGSGADESRRSSSSSVTGAVGATGTRGLIGESDVLRRRTEFAHELDRLRREIRTGAERTPLPGEPEDPFEPDPLGRRITAPPRVERGEDAQGADPMRQGDGEKGEETPEERAAKERQSLDDLVAVLKHGKEVDRLSDSMSERVREVVALGETSMKEGAFFNAEKHFTMALMISPGNPLALAGLVNAQLGAGLVSSSAVTLRNLYADHPELIDVRFAPELLPSKERLVAIRDRLNATSIDARNAADVGLLTAYVGRQFDDRASIERGLSMMTGHPGDEVLAKLLRGIWLDQNVGPPAGEAAPVAPAAPEASAAPAAATAPANPSAPAPVEGAP